MWHRRVIGCRCGAVGLGAYSMMRVNHGLARRGNCPRGRWVALIYVQGFPLYFFLVLARSDFFSRRANFFGGPSGWALLSKHPDATDLSHGLKIFHEFGCAENDSGHVIGPIMEGDDSTNSQFR